MITDFLFSGLALITVACGIYLLQAAWRSRGPHLKQLITGWALILAGTIVFSFKIGPEKGVAFGLVAFSTLALVFLLKRYVQTEPKAAKEMLQKNIEQEKLGALVVIRRIFVFLLAAIFALLAALSLSTVSFSILRGFGVEHTANLVFAMFFFPICWATLVTIIGADKKLWRKSLITFGVGLVPLTFYLIGS